MSQENVALVRRSYEALKEAYSTGDFLTVFEEFADPAIVVAPSGAFPESEELRGYDGLLRFVTRQTDVVDVFWVEPQELIDAGDRVAVPVRFGGRTVHSGLELQFEVVHVWTTHNRKLTRLDVYANKSEALKAVGLAE